LLYQAFTKVKNTFYNKDVIEYMDFGPAGKIKLHISSEMWSLG